GRLGFPSAVAGLPLVRAGSAIPRCRTGPGQHIPGAVATGSDKVQPEVEPSLPVCRRHRTASRPRSHGLPPPRLPRPRPDSPPRQPNPRQPQRQGGPRVTPRRSVLYMPGANERALEKAKTLPADALIFDLEDAVSPDAKEAARERVCAAAASGDYGKREVAIRVNGLDTDWHDADLRAAAQAGPAAVVVPKVNSARDVMTIERALELNGAPEHTMIWAM